MGREIHVIDYYENSGVGVGVEHYAKHLQGLPYVYGAHHGPHDIEANSFAANGKSAKDVFLGYGVRFNTIPRVPDKQDSINAGRAILSRCYFDTQKTERGRLALMSYHFQWDDSARCSIPRPTTTGHRTARMHGNSSAWATSSPCP